MHQGGKEKKNNKSSSLLSPDLQIRRGDGHPDPEIRGRAGNPNFGLKIRGPSLGTATEKISLSKRHRSCNLSEKH